MQKLYKRLNKPLVPGLLGIEVEVESKNDLPRGAWVDDPDHDHPPSLGAWYVERDGSLRGESAEYVLKKPLSLPAAMTAISDLRKKLENCELIWSFRTSVHVHVNVLNMTLEQIKCLIYTYLLLEEVMVHFCGEGRVANRFCLRVTDAEAVVEALSVFFASPEFNFPRQDAYRYSSLNLDALRKFGSIEFRAMRGTLDKDVLDVWVNALVRLRSFSMKYKSVNEIASKFVNTPDEQFLVDVFGEQIAKAIMPENGNLSAMMSETYSLTMALLLADKGIK